jgi:hypothetical protein
VRPALEKSLSDLHVRAFFRAIILNAHSQVLLFSLFLSARIRRPLPHSLPHFPRVRCSCPLHPRSPNLSCANLNLDISFVPFEERYPPEWTFQKGAAMPDGQVFANVPIRCAAHAVCVLRVHGDTLQ